MLSCLCQYDISTNYSCQIEIFNATHLYNADPLLTKKRSISCSTSVPDTINYNPCRVWKTENSWVTLLTFVTFSLQTVCYPIGVENWTMYGRTMAGIWLTQPMAQLPYAGFLQLYVVVEIDAVYILLQTRRFSGSDSTPNPIRNVNKY